MAKPSGNHWNAAKKVLRYLKGTVNLGIMYTDESDVVLTGFSDSDWAGNPDDRRSTSGYAFHIGSGVVSWSSKKQPTVSLSSTESEYKALTNATCEAIWLWRILADLEEAQSGATCINCDNQSAIKLAHNPVYHVRTKHVELQYHFIPIIRKVHYSGQPRKRPFPLRLRHLAGTSSPLAPSPSPRTLTASVKFTNPANALTSLWQSRQLNLKIIRCKE
eukprot:PITA_13986